MNEAGISIPWWGWLALIAALVACAIVAKIARDIRATKTSSPHAPRTPSRSRMKIGSLFATASDLAVTTSHGRANGATKRKQLDAAR